MVALVRGVHGLRGAVRAEVLTDRPDHRFVPGAVLYREGDDRPLTIASADAIVDGPGWRIRFREVESRDAADGLRGLYLEAVVRPQDDLARGTYYWHEVVGTTVRGVDGNDLGVVQDIYRIGETEVYVIGGGRYGTFDVPAVRAFIRIFAPRRGEIVVDAAALDLHEMRSKVPDPDRPRAPRRKTRRRTGPDPADPTSRSGQMAPDGTAGPVVSEGTATGHPAAEVAPADGATATADDGTT